MTEQDDRDIENMLLESAEGNEEVKPQTDSEETLQGAGVASNPAALSASTACWGADGGSKLPLIFADHRIVVSESALYDFRTWSDISRK